MSSERFMPLTPKVPSADGLRREKEMGDGGTIERVRELVDSIKAAYDFKTKPRESSGPIHEQIDPRVVDLLKELREEILSLPKELKNQKEIVYALKHGDVTELDRLIPSYYELFPAKRNPPYHGPPPTEV